MRKCLVICALLVLLLRRLHRQQIHQSQEDLGLFFFFFQLETMIPDGGGLPAPIIPAISLSLYPLWKYDSKSR